MKGERNWRSRSDGAKKPSKWIGGKGGEGVGRKGGDPERPIYRYRVADRQLLGHSKRREHSEKGHFLTSFGKS